MTFYMSVLATCKLCKQLRPIAARGLCWQTCFVNRKVFTTMKKVPPLRT